MNKKFLSAILFGALMVTSTGTFVSCKDYDDDIDSLQGQVDTNESAISALNSQLSSLQTAGSAAQATADAAKAAADAAKKAGDEATAAAKAAEAAAAQAKADAIAEAAKQVEALKTIVEANKLSQDELEAAMAIVSGKIDAIEAGLSTLTPLVDQVLADIVAIKADIEEQEAALKALKESTGSNEAIEDVNASIEELYLELQSLQGNVSQSLWACIEDVDAALAKISDLEGKAETLESMVGQLSLVLSTLVDDTDTTKQDLKELWEAIYGEGSSINTLMGQLANRVSGIAAEANTLNVMFKSRLTSLSVIPTTHVNGIAAISLTTLQYTPQVYKAIVSHSDPLNEHASNPILDHINASSKVYSISTDRNVAYFHVNPNVGVQTKDIELPLFDCIASENVLTRGAGVTENSPVKPVEWSIDKNVLTVYFKKTVAQSIAAEGGHEDGKETFYMASLKAPIAYNNLTDEEKEAYDGNGTKVYVNSEYVRLHEEIRLPYLVNTKTDFTKKIGDNFAVETQIDNETIIDTNKGEEFYVHYHDSVCVYESEANEFVDIRAEYDKPFDLKKLVTVCTTGLDDTEEHNAHTLLSNYKDYGLTFRFTLAKAAYNTLGGVEGNSNKTDQQKFASIDDPMNGIMTSKVYTIDGVSATAVGREPIVRVELVDTLNNALVAQRYLKVKWVKEAGIKNLEYNYPDSIYVCGNYNGRIGTQVMNEAIYSKAKQGGMTKQEFHYVYTDIAFDGVTGKGEGEAELLINSENGVDSYNILWTLTHQDIVKKYPVWSAQETMSFSKVVYWKDPTGAYPTLAITLTRTIYKPQFGLYGYDGRYWKNDGKWSTFNVNPIVYNTIEYNPAWNDNTDHKNNPTCNIYTDLLNGFLNVDSKKPLDGVDKVIYFMDKLNKCGATEKIPYMGVATAKHTHTGYNDEGVRFVFDKEKLEAANTTYKYNFFNGTKIVETTAVVKNNGTELWIGNQLAATIVNGVANMCTDPANPSLGGLTYNIKLQEEAPDHAPRSGEEPTEAAKALVGELVPIKLIADLCYDETDAKYAKAHLETIKAYDAFIIEPLTVKRGDTEDFTDATIGGSTIDVKGAFTYVSWNADEKGNKYVVSNAANATALQKELWEFYEVVEGQWMTDQIKTNLKVDANGNLVPTAGVTNGPLPSNTTVVFKRDSATGEETLTYNNYSGTPVNWNYKMFIPVKFGYKWKTFTFTFEVDVIKNAGTPAE